MALASTIAGTWYPGSEKGIRRAVELWEASAPHSETAAEKANVLILPHAGWAYSGEIAWQAVRQIKGAKFKRVVLLAPSHRAWIDNRLVAPESSAVSTPLGEIAIDRDFIDRLALAAPLVKNDRVHSAEHATQIEYPFLQLALGEGFKIVPLIAGSFGKDQMDMCARALSQLMDSETLLVVSSDFTHYGSDFDYAPYGLSGGQNVREQAAAVDKAALDCIAGCDADGFSAHVAKTGATICGHVPIELALRAFPANASLACVRYATSGDLEGDYTRFVCYAAVAGCVEWPDGRNAVLGKAEREYLLEVARKSMECAVRGEKFSLPGAPFPIAGSTISKKMGAFVTLTDGTTGALRGCIGEILPMRPLVDAVAARAVDAALHARHRTGAWQSPRRSFRPYAANAGRLLARHRSRTRRHDA